jgi:eukaryotic-like serine/threonine-protein kinase
MIGRSFGREGQYLVQEKLGEGGMGVVYRAHDRKNERVVALKFLRTDGAVDPETIARFKNEGRKFGVLRHPNLVRVYALGREEGVLYIASEFVEGKNLYQRIVREGPFTVDRALEVVEFAAAWLAVAHKERFVHRDLKPENIMIRDADGVVKVLDFGIAKDLNASIALTAAGAYLGTPSYSSPEQIDGEAVDGRSDIFALGVILYETRRRAPTPIAEFNREVGGSVARLIDRMIMKAPSKRFATCEDLVDEIRAVRKAVAENPDAEAETETGVRGFLKRFFGDDA